jgi:hypothetical protein
MEDIAIGFGGFSALVMRFVLNLIAVTLLVRFIYLKIKNRREFAFAFYLSNVLIFFLCYMMSGAQISMGFAFGLFAVFGILRYRTTTLPIKEMTYLFASIALALINGLANDKMSFAELIFVNSSIIVVVFILERVWSVNKTFSKRVFYERIDLIEEGDNEAIIEDLKRRTGLEVQSFTVKNINFVEGKAELRVVYDPEYGDN